jgi:hypothetical protein
MITIHTQLSPFKPKRSKAFSNNVDAMAYIERWTTRHKFTYDPSDIARRCYYSPNNFVHLAGNATIFWAEVAQ